MKMAASEALPAGTALRTVSAAARWSRAARSPAPAGPVAAKSMRHGISRSAVAPDAWITKWNAPAGGQPTSPLRVESPSRNPGRPPSAPPACTTNAKGAWPSVVSSIAARVCNDRHRGRDERSVRAGREDAHLRAVAVRIGRENERGALRLARDRPSAVEQMIELGRCRRDGERAELPARRRPPQRRQSPRSRRRSRSRSG